MSNNLFEGRRRHAAALTASVLSLVVLAGCGGGNSANDLLGGVPATGGPSSPAQPGATGRVQLSIAWPERKNEGAAGPSRYLPVYAASLVLELTSKEDPARKYRLVVDRPGGERPPAQTVSFNDRVRIGEYVLNGTAHADPNGGGAAVAAATADVTVRFNATSDVALTLDAALASLEVVGAPLRFDEGTVFQLRAQGRDAQGRIVLLPAGNGVLTWSLVSGGGALQIDANGVATAKAGGTARVRVVEAAANLSAEADVTVTGATAGAGLATASWPKARGDARNTGNIGNGAGAVGTGQIVREFALGGTVAAEPTVGPDGTLYVATQDGKLYAFDTATGAQKWVWDSGSPFSIFGAPAVGANGLVYVAAGFNGLVALEASTGAKRFSTSGDDVFDSPTGAPTIGADGTVYAADRSMVYAYDGETGAIKWSFDNGVNEGGTSRSISPALAPDGTLYVPLQTAFFESSLYALDSATGAKKTELGLGGRVDRASVSVGADGAAYLRVSTEVWALNAGLQRAWTGSAHISGGNDSPSVALSRDGATVYSAGQLSFASGGNHGLAALDSVTGEPRWNATLLPAAEGYGDFRAPVVGSDGTIYVGQDASLGTEFPYTAAFLLYAVSDSGEKLWQVTLPASDAADRSLTDPAFGPDGTVYVGANDKVYAIQ